MRSYFLLSLLSLLVFSSCEKKEKPITLPAKGDGQVLQVDMGETYENQFFVSLQDQKLVHASKVDCWDLAFQSGSNDHSIFLNGGKGMAAFNTHKTKFNEVGYNDTLQAKASWGYDSPTGITDSAAIGDWKQETPIYLVKLNEIGNQVRKLQIVYEDIFEYRILVGDISTTVPVSITIPKDKNCNFTYFSFDLLKTVPDVEPYKDSWDIQITRYNYTFYEEHPALRYVVNGVLLNPNHTVAYKDSLTDYNNIDINFANSVPLSANRDVIGWDWKFYDRAVSGNYIIIKKYNYIIKNQNNHSFKLHFLDYYSATGVKGSPKFEFKQLQ